MKNVIAVLVFVLNTGGAFGQHMKHENETTVLAEGGQAGFAAVSEVISRLDADPETNWAKVNIATLVDHLRDMDTVFRGLLH